MWNSRPRLFLDRAWCSVPTLRIAKPGLLEPIAKPVLGCKYVLSTN
jgi:hypothetical protein